MLRTLFYVAAVLLVFLLIVCNNEKQNYVQCKPVYANNHARSKNSLYEVSNEEISSEHIENMSFVLNNYNVPFIEKDGEIFLPQDVWADKDIVMNYTEKANDPDWIRQREAKKE